MPLIQKNILLLFLASNIFAQPFQKGTINPSIMYPVDISSKPAVDRVLLATLQGIVAKSSTTQLFLYTQTDENGGYVPTSEDQSKGLTSGMLFFKNYLTTLPNIKVYQSPKNNTWDIVNNFKSYISGYALFNPGTDSENMAATYCGLNNCIPVATSDIALAKHLGLKLDKDFTLYQYSYTNFITDFGKQINKNFAIELNPSGKDVYLKDYAAMLGGIIFYSGTNNTIRDAVLNQLIGASNPNPIPVYGWNAASGDEGAFVNDISANGNFVVASDNSMNLSFFSSSNTKPIKVNYKLTKINYNPSMTYVTFIISDGDNIQFVTNKANDQRWWGNANRGQFPVGWTMPPAMFYLEPDIWNYFVQTATKNDEFIAGPSGIGYVFEGVAGSSKFKKQQNYLEEFLNDSGLKAISIFGYNNNAWNNTNSFLSTYLANSSVSGIFYSQFSIWMAQTGYSTQLVPGIDKPIIPENEYLTGTDSNSNALAIANDINSNLTQKNDGFYAVYAMRNDGDNTMDWLTTLNNTLDKTKIQLVLPSQFIDLEQQSRNFIK